MLIAWEKMYLMQLVDGRFSRGVGEGVRVFAGAGGEFQVGDDLDGEDDLSPF